MLMPEIDSVTALRPLLAALEPQLLTALRETVASAEEAAWRGVVARRVCAIGPGSYEVAVFEAVETRLSVGHDDYSDRAVELYADREDDPSACVDFNDAVLARALGALAELLRPSEGARLTVDLEDGAN